MSSYKLPNARAVKDLFEDLLGREVSVARGAPIRAAELARTAAAIYTEGGLNMAAVIGLDVNLAAHSAASMSLVPRAEAAACAKAGTLPALLEKNTVELFEHMAKLLEQPGSPALRLYETFMPGDQIPADVASQLVALGRRVDAELAISGGYGGGRLSFTLAEPARR
jgi:hypothetical protein